jgi:hypothetical protein
LRVHTGNDSSNTPRHSQHDYALIFTGKFSRFRHGEWPVFVLNPVQERHRRVRRLAGTKARPVAVPARD